MEVPYHVRPCFVGICPYTGLTSALYIFIYGRYLQFRFLKWPFNGWYFFSMGMICYPWHLWGISGITALTSINRFVLRNLSIYPWYEPLSTDITVMVKESWPILHSLQMSCWTQGIVLHVVQILYKKTYFIRKLTINFPVTLKLDVFFL